MPDFAYDDYVYLSEINETPKGYNKYPYTKMIQI